MQQSPANGSVVLVPPQEHHSRVADWLRGLSNILPVAFSRRAQNSTALALRDIDASQDSPEITNTGPSCQHRNPVYLLSCVHKNRKDTALYQDDISSIRNDRELFTFLRPKISERRNRLSRLMACRCITGIFFTKFALSSTGDVEIFRRDLCDHSSPLAGSSYCECLPPVYLVKPFEYADYRCIIGTHSFRFPPVSPQYLVHNLNKPECGSEGQSWVLGRIPKRTTGELIGGTDEPNEGWGLYYEEGWNFNLIATISFVVVTVGSLLFGICWSVLESDIQGAFGVSGYMIAVCGLIVAFVLSKMA